MKRNVFHIYTAIRERRKDVCMGKKKKKKNNKKGGGVQGIKN